MVSNMRFEDTEALHLAQKPSLDVVAVAPEHTLPLRMKIVALVIYFLCNIGLTLYNKAVLEKFDYPWLLTALHAGSASVGCTAIMLRGRLKPSKLTSRNYLALLAFSTLFTLNIAISNLSLATVSIPFHQVMRATCPLITTIIFRVAYGRIYNWATYLSLAAIMFGVALTTYGEYSYTSRGFLVTFLGVLLSALKTVVTNRFLTGNLALSPLELLYHMSPIALIQSLTCAVLSGEVAHLFFTTKTLSSTAAYATALTILAILGNGILACLLNISSFSTNKVVGALTMTLCANVKQCITIVLGVVLFGMQINYLNATGLLVTITGCAWYSILELSPSRHK